MRAIVRALLMLILLVVVAVLLLNYWPAGLSFKKSRNDSTAPRPATPGTIDSGRVRERAADIGEKAAAAKKKLQGNLEETGNSTKIKAMRGHEDSLNGG